MRKVLYGWDHEGGLSEERMNYLCGKIIFESAPKLNTRIKISKPSRTKAQ